MKSATSRPLRRCAALPAAVALAATLAGCGIVFDAPDIDLLLQDEGIVYATADGAAELVGGETVVTVRNTSNQRRQVVLAEVEEGTKTVPQVLAAAEQADDDDRILGFSQPLPAEEISYATGGGKKTAQASFHIYLRPGDTYVLFDRLDPDLVLWLQPGPQQAAQ